MSAQTAMFFELFRLIQQAKRILVVSDGRPDGDSVGSATALMDFLKRWQKSFSAFCVSQIPKSLIFLDHSHLFSSDNKLFNQAFDLVATCDASNLEHCGIKNLLPHLPKPFTMAVIDHHKTNDGYGDVNIIIRDACSTAEVVYRFFLTQNIQITPAAATSLLTGIFTDTTGFSNPATTSSGMEAASDLLAKGARHADIIRHIMKNKSIRSLKIWGLALSRLRYHPRYRLASTYFTQADLQYSGAQEEDMDGVSDFLHRICGGCENMLVAHETSDGYIRGSLRSMTRDVAKVAGLFGGGGHAKAAGFTMKGKLPH